MTHLLHHVVIPVIILNQFKIKALTIADGCINLFGLKQLNDAE